MKLNIQSALLLSILAFFGMGLDSYGQNAPKGISYQGVARSAAGTVMSDISVDLQVSILDGSSTGPILYSEMHTTGINHYGQFTILIGHGTSPTGVFDTIPWKNGNQYLKVELYDPQTILYTLLDTTRLLSVPFAFYSNTTSFKPPVVRKGLVNTDGTVLSGTNFTVSHPDNGVYQVLFDNPLAASPTVNVTPEDTLGSASAAATYCTSTHANGCLGDDITHVVLNTLDNLTTGCGGATHYTYFTGGGTQTTTLTAGGSPYNLTVSFGTDGSQYCGAWIDYDQDGVLASTEFLGASTNAGSSGTVSVPFTVPATALNGITRLRVVGGNDSPVTAAQACGASSSGFGETQDYDVTIINGVPFTPVLIVSKVFPSVSDVSTSGFTVHLLNSSGNASDQKFHFIAQ